MHFSPAIFHAAKFLIMKTLFLIAASLIYSSIVFSQAGLLDNSFNGNGTVHAEIGDYNAFGYKVAIQSDGKIIVAGYYDQEQNGPEGVTIVCFNSDGSLN